MRKKCLAGIMVLCLLLSMMPTMAFATEAECTKTEGCTAVAHEEGCPAADPAGGGDGNDPTVLLDEPADGYTEWTSTDSLPTSGTYRLATNVTVTEKTTVGGWASSRPETPAKVLTLDLNGHTITATNGQAFFVQTSGGLVIEDSKGNGKITNQDAGSSNLIYVGGSFELKSGTLENAASNGYALFLNSSSTATLSGGTVINTAKGGSAVQVNSSANLTMTAGEIQNTVDGGNAVYVNGNAGTFTMEGGKVTQESTYSSSAAIYANNSATSVSISGGEVVSNSMGVYAAFTPVSVTGGTFQTKSHAFQTRNTTIEPAAGKTVSVDSEGAVFYTFSESNNKIVDGEFTAPALTKSYTQEEASNLTVSGGTFDIQNIAASTNDNSEITISGGTFEKAVPDLDRYLDTDKEIQIQPDGSLIVGESSGETPADPVSVTINGGETNSFGTLAAAIEEVNKASAGDSITVSLGKDQIVTETIQINKDLNVTLDLGGKTLRGPDSGYTIQFGSFDKGGAAKPEDCEYTNSGTLTLTNGAVIGYRGILNYFGNVVLDQGLTLTTTERVVNTYGGKITVQGAKLKSTTAFGVGLFNSFYPFDFNASSAVTNSTHEKNKSAEFVMTAGSIDVVYYPVSGNNQRSAGTKATITGGTLTASEEYTAIYWPMEGELTVGGDAVITGGTGIEAKMGTITVKENAQIIGTAAYKADEPTNGGSSPEGSALLLTSQMYGAEGQYQTSNLLTVNIIGGTLTSQKGNAVTVYNTEKNTAQTTHVTVSGGQVNGKLSGITSVTTGENTVTTNGNTQTTSKSNTTLTVSGSVAPASINADGSTAYFANVTQAIASLDPDATEKTQISVFGNSTISTDVELQENITLVVAPGVQLTADVTSGESEKVVVTEQDANGNTVYKLVAKPENPEQTYVASITANGQTAYFDTLAAAVKTVQSGQTITLLKNSDTTGTITISRAVTFTLDPKTFTMKDTIAAGSGFVLTRSGNTYTVSVYTPPTPVTPDDNNSGSSSDHDSDYTISLPSRTPGGTVKASPRYAESGETVTLTVTPDAGYELDNLSVTDRKGNEVKLTEKGDGQYTFKMPNSRVEVQVAFTRVSSLPFADVAEDAWFRSAVEYVYENGLMNGTTATTFTPNATTSRGMIVAILWRQAGSPTVDYLMEFNDVAPTAYYGEAVRWAASEGIVGGYGDGRFGPNDTITRQQLAAILYRFAQPQGYDTSARADLSGYADLGAVSSYAVEALQWANAEGLVNGTSATTLSPGGNATRAQAAVILSRFCQSIAQ